MIFDGVHYKRIEHKKYKYQTTVDVVLYVGIFGYSIETAYFKLTRDGVLLIKAGYMWDGCSGPTWDTKNTMLAGLGHDCLYQILRESLLISRSTLNYDERFDKLRLQVDQSFRQWLAEDGVCWIRCYYYYRGVRALGRKYALPRVLK